MTQRKEKMERKRKSRRKFSFSTLKGRLTGPCEFALGAARPACTVRWTFSLVDIARALAHVRCAPARCACRPASTHLRSKQYEASPVLHTCTAAPILSAASATRLSSTRGARMRSTRVSQHLSLSLSLSLCVSHQPTTCSGDPGRPCQSLTLTGHLTTLGAVQARGECTRAYASQGPRTAQPRHVDGAPLFMRCCCPATVGRRAQRRGATPTRRARSACRAVIQSRDHGG
jgi:hypothetical protein